jgi:hypothetical protein
LTVGTRGRELREGDSVPTAKEDLLLPGGALFEAAFIAVPLLLVSVVLIVVAQLRRR